VAKPEARVSPVRATRYDRVAVLTGLGGVSAAAWIYLVVDGRHFMAGMSGRSMSAMAPAMQSMTQLRPWSAGEFGLCAGDVGRDDGGHDGPTAATMTLVYAAVARKAARQASPVAPTYVFAAVYVAMWVLFSLARPPLKTASPTLRSSLRQWCLLARCSAARSSSAPGCIS